MSEKKEKNLSKFEAIPNEVIGEILNFVDDVRVISSLCLTSKSYHEFFESASVYNKCRNIVFKIKSTDKIKRYFVTHLRIFLSRQKIGMTNMLLSQQWEDVIVDDIDFKNFPRLEKLFICAIQNNRYKMEISKDLKLPDELKALHIYDVLLYSENILNMPKGLIELSIEKSPGLRDITSKFDLNGLKHLVLVDNAIGPQYIQNMKLPLTLEILDLSNNKLGPDSAERFNSSLLPNLLELYLNKTSIGDGVTKLKVSEKLKILQLADNHITFSALEKLWLPPELKELDLSYNNFSGDRFRFYKFPDLLKLKLRACDISDFNVPNTLEALDLSINNIMFMEKEFNFDLLKSLSYLNLSWNTIRSIPHDLDDENIVTVKQVKLPPRLKVLDLSGTGITDRGLEYIEIPQTLIELHLTNNHITKLELSNLNTREHLKVYLYYNSIKTIKSGNIDLIF